MSIVLCKSCNMYARTSSKQSDAVLCDRCSSVQKANPYRARTWMKRSSLYVEKEVEKERTLTQVLISVKAKKKKKLSIGESIFELLLEDKNE